MFAVFGGADGRDEVFAGEHGLVDMARDKICVVDTLKYQCPPKYSNNITHADEVVHPYGLLAKAALHLFERHFPTLSAESSPGQIQNIQNKLTPALPP